MAGCIGKLVHMDRNHDIGIRILYDLLAFLHVLLFCTAEFGFVFTCHNHCIALILEQDLQFFGDGKIQPVFLDAREPSHSAAVKAPMSRIDNNHGISLIHYRLR